jgi:hypothetical protein
VRLYDIDVLGVQSRLTVDGEVQWDSPRGTQGFGGLELRIPLGAVTRHARRQAVAARPAHGRPGAARRRHRLADL